MELHPTLWRTCRVLAGETRLALLRHVVESPGKTVSRLAGDVKIGLSLASQELRRLQSRGLIQAVRKGSFVHYLPAPDPQVPEASFLLAALKEAFSRFNPAKDVQIMLIATALSHPRRIRILQELLAGSRTVPMIREATRIPPESLYRHLPLLRKGFLIRQNNRIFRAARPAHPLAKCLVELVKATGKPRSS